MSLVLEALNKAKQSEPGRAGPVSRDSQLQIMTGGIQPTPSTTSRVGVLIGAAVGVVGVMLAIAVVVLGMMLKPAPQAANAQVAPAPPELPVVATTPEPAIPSTPTEPVAVAAAPILEVQPFINELMVQPATQEPAKVDAPEKTDAAPVEPAKEQEAAKPAETPAPPAPPAEPKEPLQAGIEYVQTLDVSDAPQIKLGAVIWSDNLKVALINGATMQIGDGVTGVKLLEIEPKRVKLEYGDKTFWLRLP